MFAEGRAERIEGLSEDDVWINRGRGKWLLWEFRNENIAREGSGCS